MALAMGAAPARCCAFKSRHTSRAIAGGVRITASAKLNSSARAFATPSNIPVEMVAPDRENPRKGRHSPWMPPIQPACVMLSPVEPETRSSRAPEALSRLWRRPAIRDQNSHSGQCWSDQVEAAKQFFHLRMLAMQHQLFNALNQSIADDRR